MQDNSLLVTDASRGPLVLGADVTIGHNVRLGAATIGDHALIGMGSQVGDGVVVEEGGCIGARAWVEPGTVVKAGWIWVGRPAFAFREIKPAGARGVRAGGEDLRRLRRRVSPRRSIVATVGVRDRLERVRALARYRSAGRNRMSPYHASTEPPVLSVSVSTPTPVRSPGSSPNAWRKSS